MALCAFVIPASIVSQSTCTESLPSTTSDSGELEVVVVDGASSVKTSSQTQVRETKGKTGAAVLEADWVDCSSDSDVPNTDDEFNSDNEDASSRRSSLVIAYYQALIKIPKFKVKCSCIVK